MGADPAANPYLQALVRPQVFDQVPPEVQVHRTRQ